MSCSQLPAMAEQQTQFLVHNLHCPSCVSYIEELLLILRPKPSAVVCSLVSHLVTVTHDAAVKPATIHKLLANNGYDPVSVTGEDLSYDIESLQEQHTHVSGLKRARQKLRSIWAPDRTGNHISHCKLCQDTKPNDDTLLDEADDKSDSGIADGVDQSPKSLDEQFEAVIAVEGMTCSSCVNAINSALIEKSWITSVDVNLLTNSASIRLSGKEHIANVLETLEDIGYGATLDTIRPLKSMTDAGKSKAQTWRGIFSLTGMSCSSCVSTINEILNRESSVVKVDVNLLQASAVVDFTGRENLSRIMQIVKSAGYAANLVDLANLDAGNITSSERTISIRVGNMYCEHCPLRVISTLKDQPRVSLQSILSLKDPIVTVSYTPDPPAFTVRRILAMISDIDENFVATLYSPPSLEERTRRMRLRERQHIAVRVILSLIAAIPTFIIGIVFMSLLSDNHEIREYLMRPWARVSRGQWALFITATPVYFLAADVFHRRAFKNLYALWRPGSKTPLLRRFYRFGSMDLLISLGTSIAYFSSVANLIIVSTHDSMDEQMNAFYFDSVVFLTLFLLTGRLLEAWSKAKTDNAVSDLGSLRPSEALLLTNVSAGDSGILKVSPDEAEIGEILQIPHGTSAPRDGFILSGAGRFDESSLTGESKLVNKSIGNDVFSGTINQGAPVTIRITQAVGASMLDDIMRVMREGQAKRAPIERFADTITGMFVPFVTLFATLTWVVWIALAYSGALPIEWLDIESGGWAYWSLQFAIAAFIVACPCGIGLAAPTALFVGGGIAAKHGILAKGGGEAFQQGSQVDVVVFDKTGTLTEGGDRHVTQYEFLNTDILDESVIASVTRLLEESSSHPLAVSVSNFLNDRIHVKARKINADEIPGMGMKGRFAVENLENVFVDVLVGNERLLADHHVKLDAQVTKKLLSWKSQGHSIVIVAIKEVDDEEGSNNTWKVHLLCGISDPIRAESPVVVTMLRKRGIDVWMISGDNQVTAEAVGHAVGIPPDKIISGMLPQQKAEMILQLQNSRDMTMPTYEDYATSGLSSKRVIVAMVGDGVNDAPALAAADVGIAIGSGSDVAIASADFVLISSQLSSLVVLLQLSHKVLQRIKLNFAWALVYNLVALPIAAGVLYPIRSNGNHVRLDPVWASLAMALSSVSVVMSSLALKLDMPVIGHGKLYAD